MREALTVTAECQATASTAEQEVDLKPAADTSEARQAQPSIERRGLGRITIRWLAIGFSAVFWLLLVWLLFS